MLSFCFYFQLLYLSNLIQTICSMLHKLSFSFRTLSLLLGLLLVACVACDKKEDAPTPINPNEKGTMRFEFDNVVGEENLQLGTTRYQNAHGEDFTVTLLNYYLSNFVLIDENGKEYVVPQEESYFLVKESDKNSQFISIPNVPAGNYKSVRFMIGVDSLRNTMDLSRRTGVLDPANNTGENKMYWSWNSGYIFFKMEGLSSKAAPDPNGENKFRYHIGGFGGYESPTINNIKTVTLNLGTKVAQVRQNQTPLLHITVDLLKVFEGVHQVRIAENSTVMFNPFSTKIADNYVNMFMFHHLHND